MYGSMEKKSRVAPAEYGAERESGWELTDYITKFGRYHLFFFALCFVPCLQAGVQALHSSFTTAVPNLRCCAPSLENCNASHANLTFNSSAYATERLRFWHSDNDKENYCHYCPGGMAGANATCGVGAAGKAAMKDCNNGFVLDRSIYETSVAIKFGLYCQDAYKHELIPTMFMLGLLLCGLLSGFISDRFGRRPTFLIGVTGFLISSACTPLSPSYPVYILLTICNGFFNNIVPYHSLPIWLLMQAKPHFFRST